LNQQMYNWYLLNKYKKLEPRHKNIPSFNGVLDLGKYMTSYYADELKDLANEAEREKLKKLAKSIKLVDNDDYKIYITLNRSSNMLIGANTTWCTTNSSTHAHWDSYSAQGFLYQLFPKQAEQVSIKRWDRNANIEGFERYQFGPDRSYSFKDIGDQTVSSEVVRERFPYLYTDITTALKQHKGEYQKAIDELSEDPAMKSDPSIKVPHYKIDDEIKKLKGFIDRGYMTEEKRPTEKSKDDSEESPQLEKPEQEQSKGNQQMENVDKDVAAMLQTLKKYDKLVESVAPVLMARPVAEDSHLEGGKKSKWSDDPKDHFKSSTEKFVDKFKKGDKKEDKKKVEESKVCPHCQCDPCECPGETVKEGADQEVLNWMKRFSKLGNMKGYGI